MARLECSNTTLSAPIFVATQSHKASNPLLQPPQTTNFGNPVAATRTAASSTNHGRTHLSAFIENNTVALVAGNSGLTPERAQKNSAQI